MAFLLHLFLSGDIFFIGLAMTAVAAMASGRLARGGVVCGLALALLSAVPAPLLAYVALVAAAILWWIWMETPAPRGRVARTALVLTALANVALEIPFHFHGATRLDAAIPLVILGDSLVAGRSAWPGTFAEQSGCRIQNNAAGGAPLAAGPRQLGTPKPPCQVLVALGGNDLLGRIGPDRFHADLETLLRQVRSSGCDAVMLELPLFPLQNRYGRAQRTLASRYGVALVPRRVLAGTLTRAGHTTDGLHLSSAGHAWLGRAVSEWVRCETSPPSRGRPNLD